MPTETETDRAWWWHLYHAKGRELTADVVVKARSHPQGVPRSIPITALGMGDTTDLFDVGSRALLVRSFPHEPTSDEQEHAVRRGWRARRFLADIVAWHGQWWR